MTYRPDIDGLRAVAILPVLFFHLEIGGFGGGFVGVDVFFVISGYLITTLLMAGLADGSFGLWHFYRRRAARILPPLLVVIAFCVVMAWFLLLPGETEELGRSIVAAVFFVSNFYFWDQADYFTPVAKSNPLLHSWSLAVEEQFYLIVPLFLLVAHRFLRRHIKMLLAISVLASFLLSLYAVPRAPVASFYLLPTRYWELGAGALLAAFGPGLAPRGWRADATAGLGIGLIAASVLILSADTAFPGLAAAAPVLGAVLVIGAGPGSVIGRLLATPLPVGIGRISYSLYLWHWPIIVFYKLQNGSLGGGAEKATLALIAGALAWISYLRIEQPFRKSTRLFGDRIVLASAGTAVTVAALAGVGLGQIALDWRAYPAEIRSLYRYGAYVGGPEHRAQYRTDRCFLLPSTPGGIAAFDPATCLAADPAGRSYLLIGDSHAGHLWKSLQSALPPGTALLQATAAGCRPVIGTAGGETCVDLMRYMFGDWLRANPVDGVILAARWSEPDVAPLVTTVAALRKMGVPEVIVLGPTVEYFGDLPALMARDAMTGTRTLAARVDPRPRARDRRMRAALRGSAARYVSVHDIVCPDGACQTRAGGVPFQFDFSHFTLAGADIVARAVAASLPGPVDTDRAALSGHPAGGSDLR